MGARKLFKYEISWPVVLVPGLSFAKWQFWIPNINTNIYLKLLTVASACGPILAFNLGSLIARDLSERPKPDF